MMHWLCIALLLSAAPAAAQTKLSTGVRTAPAPGAIASATVGSPIFERSTFQQGKGASLGADVELGIPIGMKLRAPMGTRLNLEVDVPGKVRACSVGETVYTLGSPYEPGCFWDDDNDGRFDRAGRSIGLGVKKLSSPVPYSRIDIEFPALGGERQTLIYSGLDGKTLRLSYREFKDDFARPAFTQDLTFTLSGSYPEAVAFRDVKITILGIDNSGIRYRIEP